MAVVFILLAHGIDKLILRKTRAECVKQMLIFCTFLPNPRIFEKQTKLG